MGPRPLGTEAAKLRHRVRYTILGNRSEEVQSWGV